MSELIKEENVLILDGKEFRTAEEFAAYMKSVMYSSIEEFESLCHSLVDYSGNLDPQLEKWLVAIGKQKELAEWKETLN